MSDQAGSALTADELDQLQHALVEQMETAGCMALDMAHGFLTATATAADSQQTALLQRVLGDLADQDGLLGLLARFRAQLLADLRAADYGPLILQLPREDGSSLPLPYGWCQGYMAGVEFAGEVQRDALLADEEAGTWLTPVLSFLMYDEAQWFNPPNEAAHRETVEQLGEAAVALHRWSLAQADRAH